MTGVPGSRGILTAVVLLLSISHSLGFLSPSKGKVLPSNPYAFIHETVTLNCTVTSNSYPGNVSGRLHFVKDVDDVEKVLPMEYITLLDDRSIQLNYPVTSGKDEGPYTCKLNTTDGNNVLIGLQYTSVEYRSRKVEKIDCRVFDWRNMTCTWDLGVDYLNMQRIKVQLEWTILDGLYICPHQTTTACTWMEDDVRDSFKEETYYMRVNITTYDNDKYERVMDEALSNFTMVDTSTIVEPAPVHSLTVGNRTSTCVSLLWNHGQHMRPMMYTVNVLQKQFNTSAREITVCDLHPAMHYALKVRCIPVRYGSNETTGFYSSWTSIEAKTLEDVPSGVPGTQIGSFVYRGCNQEQICTVTIYWKPIPWDEANGEITRYTIKQENRQQGATEVMTVAESATSYDLKIRSDEEYSITLTGETRVGVSGESKPIRIPAFHNVTPPPDIVVEGGNSNLYITWGVPSGSHRKITGYTLYYCNESKVNLNCEDGIQWLSFAPEVLKYEWEVPDGNLRIIGVSVEEEIANQRVSSGIKLNSCVYVRNLDPPLPQSVSFSRLQPDNALSVEWKSVPCGERSVYITHYVLKYCPTNQHGQCKGQPVQVNVSNTEESHVIQGLSVGVKYRVTLRAVSRAGEGPESDPISKLVVNSDLSSGEIAGISVGGIFGCIVLISFIICGIRRVRRTYRNMPMEIKLPEFVKVDDDGQVYDKENNNVKKETPKSDKKKNTDNSRNIEILEARLNPKSDIKSEDIDENNVEVLELQENQKHINIPCSGESTDSDKTRLPHSGSTDPSSIQVDSYLKLALSGTSNATKQESGSDYVTKDKLSLLLAKSSSDASLDKSSCSSGQDTASSPPPPYEPPDDQKLETPPPTYSSYVSSQTDLPADPKERQMSSFPMGDNSSSSNSHPLSVLLELQHPLSSPCGDTSHIQTQSHEESTDLQDHVTPKPQSHCAASPYIPFDKIQPPQPLPTPQPPGELKTVPPPADGYVSVSEASQMTNKHGFEKNKDFCPTVESGNYCKVGINGSLGQLANSGYISQTDLVGQIVPSSNSSAAQNQTITTL